MPAVEDYQWLTSNVGLRHWMSIQSNVNPQSNAMIHSLRQQFSPAQSAVLYEQIKLSAAAAKKFDDASNWLWTQQLLEQSSDEQTAVETARDFPAGCSVLDCCSGAGADAIAMARAGLHVTAVDSDEVACYLTRHNSAMARVPMRVVHARAEQLVLPSTNQVALDDSSVTFSQTPFVHIDPDRRADGSRSTSLSRLSPDWETVQELRKRSKGMSLKLAPGTHVEDSQWDHHNDPPEAKRWISRDGSVRQQRWYWGIDRWPKGTVSVSMQTKSGPWCHETFTEADVSGFYETEVLTSEVSKFVADYDPVVRAGHVPVSFAKRLGLALIETRNGYLTHSEIVNHPMVRWFEVVDVLPLDRKVIRKFARSASVRTWELKSRNIDIGLDEWRKELPVDKSADTQMTVMFTKIANRFRAIFAKVVK